MQELAGKQTAPRWEVRTNREPADSPTFWKTSEPTYHLLIVPSQRSGMARGKSSHHASLPLLTTKVTHPAISEEGYDATALHKKDTIAALKWRRQGERGEQQTPQTTGGESANVRSWVKVAFDITVTYGSRNQLLAREIFLVWDLKGVVSFKNIHCWVFGKVRSDAVWEDSVFFLEMKGFGFVRLESTL